MANRTIHAPVSGTKRCKKCGIVKDASEFTPYSENSDGLRGSCRSCVNDGRTEWRRQNPEKVKASTKRNYKYIRTTVDEPEPRITNEGQRCCKCRVRKPLSDFTTDNSSINGLSHRCNTCANAHQRSWAERNPERSQKLRRVGHRRRAFGLSPEDIERMLDTQDGECVICGKSFLEVKIYVDHCHTTGIVRGLLCQQCNCGIGFLRDSLELVANAWRYLREFE
jgi:hypothetical protein